MNLLHQIYYYAHKQHATRNTQHAADAQRTEGRNRRHSTAATPSMQTTRKKDKKDKMDAIIEEQSHGGVMKEGNVETMEKRNDHEGISSTVQVALEQVVG
jgi:hypothetical protein